MEKMRYGLAAAAILGVGGLTGCGGGGSNNTFIPPIVSTATLHQFVYVATEENLTVHTGGVESYAVDGAGTVTQGPTSLINGGAALRDGLAVAANGQLLVAAFDTGTAATSGIQVFTINAATGALTAKTANFTGADTTPIIPAGPIAVDASGTKGAFQDEAHNLHGFVINSDGTTTLSQVTQPQGNVGSMNIVTVNGQDVLVASGDEAVVTKTLNATADLSANVTVVGGARSVSAVTGTTGAFLLRGGAPNNAEPFTVGNGGTLTTGTSSGFVQNGATNFDSVTAFTAGTTPSLAATTDTLVGGNNVFVGSIQQTGLTLLASGTAPGTAVASSTIQPAAGSNGTSVVVVVSTNAQAVTQVSTLAPNANNQLTVLSTATDSGGAQPGSSGEGTLDNPSPGGGAVSNTVVGTVTSFF